VEQKTKGIFCVNFLKKSGAKNEGDILCKLSKKNHKRSGEQKQDYIFNILYE